MPGAQLTEYPEATVAFSPLKQEFPNAPTSQGR